MRLLLLGLLLISSCTHRPAAAVYDGLEFATGAVRITVSGFDGPSILGQTKELEASGVVVAFTGGLTYVLSVAHAADTQSLRERTEMKNFTVTRLVGEGMLGERCVLKVVAFSRASDLALLSCEGVLGRPVSLSASYPILGEPVVTVGSPDGVKTVNFFPVLEGRFLGSSEDDDENVVVSVPTAPGASGSGVFARGKLLCVIKSYRTNINQITYCSDIGKTREFLRKSMP